MQRYDNVSSHPKSNAQRNLCGRTHYADDGTLKYFYARILSARAMRNGTLFGVVESIALDMHNTKRGVRFVVFDLFGNVINERAKHDECFASKAQAISAMMAFVSLVDVGAVTELAIAKAKRNLAWDIQETRKYLKEAETSLDTAS
jgi:hypothetical protein